MSGTHKGGKKAFATNIARYGKNFYRNIGSKGGSAYTEKLKGFAANPTLAKEVGRAIGFKTKRGYRWLGDSIRKGYGRYENRETGKRVTLKYGKAE